MYMYYHFNTYSLIRTKNRLSLNDVSKEFMRDPSAIPHIQNPLAPIIRYGVDAYEVEKIIRKRVTKARDKKGRKIRKDALVCVSSVVSFPNKLSDTSPELYEEWVQKNIQYFKSKYEDNLLSIIEHLDESNFHLHIEVGIQDTDVLGGASIDAIHRPLRKKNEAEGMKAKNTAYIKACREEQDDYYKNVAIYFGLQRTGPKRKRLTRKAYMTAKNEAELLGEALRVTKDKEVDLNAKEEKLSTAEIKITAKAKETIHKKEQLKNLERTIIQASEDIIEFENNYLEELDKTNPNRFKNFYKKRITELKNRVTNYTSLYKEYRTKFNKLLVKFTNQEYKLNKVEKENRQLKNENLQLKIHLQRYKPSDTLTNRDLKMTHHIELQ